VYFIADDGRHGRELFAVSLCAADFDLSGDADTSDVLAFVSAWFKGDRRADSNDDGAVTIEDVFNNLHARFAGCA
jgi:hypothetical protein